MSDEFSCDYCDGETECTEDCQCEDCNEARAEAYYDAYNDTYD